MDIIYQLASGVLISLITAMVTVRLSIGQFKSQQLWERKVTAYEKVIEALHNSKRFSSEHLVAGYSFREVPEERSEVLRKKSQAASEEINKASDVGAFLLSEEAVSRLNRYQQEMVEVRESENWHEYLDASYAVTKSCLADIISIAKADV